MTGRGRNYEHELARGVDTVTADDVWVTTCGYSGNSVVDACDIVITTSPKLRTRNDPVQFNIEGKNFTSTEAGKRESSVFGGSRSEETGIEELQRLIDGTPKWGVPIVAIKFSRRKLFVCDARWILNEVGVDTDDVPHTELPEAFEYLQPHPTPSDSVSMRKPATEEDYPTATASSADEVVLCETLDLPHDGDSNV